MSKPTDLKLWEKVKKQADAVYAKPSAYKSGFIVKKYKELGGKFRSDSASKKINKTSDKPNKGLTRWFKEKWVNQHGTVGYQHKNDVYRPSVRVSSKTPKTWRELSKTRIEKAKRTKAKGKRVSRF